MKTYEEMARNALDRIETYERKQKETRKVLTAAAVPALSFCLLAALGVGVWKSGALQKHNAVIDVGKTVLESSSAPAADIHVPVETDRSVQTETAETEVPVKETEAEIMTEAPVKETEAEIMTEASVKETEAVKPEVITEEPEDVKETAVPRTDIGSETAGFVQFWWENRLVVSGPLYWKLMEEPQDVLTLKAFYRPATAEITSFTYDGKTLAELADAAYEEKMMPEKMKTMLLFGDALSCGDALWQTGTPSGEKWDKDMYENQVRYLGELIDRYIVDGVFLYEELEKDAADYHETAAQDAYALAYHAYLETAMPAAGALLSENSIRWERSAAADNVLILHVTAEELRNLPLEDPGNWLFDLFTEEVKTTEGPETAADAGILYTWN